MQLSSVGAAAPVALLITAFTDWSVISLIFLSAFLLVQYKSQWRGINPWTKVVFWGLLLMLSTLAIMAEGVTTIIWVIKGRTWNTPSFWFFKLAGLDRFNPWLSISHIFFILSSQFAVVVTAACTLYTEQNHENLLDFSWGGSQVQAILRSLLLPFVLLVAGVARPCWISLPFFICSCIGLLHWSLTSSFIGLSRGWRHMLLFTGFDIVVLYLYQLPFEYPQVVLKTADYVGLFKVSQGLFGWPEAVQGIALLALYILLCVSIYDAEHAEEWSSYSRDLLPRTHSGPMLAMSNRFVEDDSLTERLLSSPRPSCERETMSFSYRRTGQKNCMALQLISINFFTYGFPVCLLILVLWSFKYASISAFFLLFYVGYVLYAFPSVHTLCRLNTALLAFILFWALCTYVFNAAFTFLQDAVDKNTELWNTIGLWHYSIPGFFLLAQFVLGVLVGADMYFSNVTLSNMHVVEERVCDVFEEEQHDTKVLVLAVVAWCICRMAHTISLVLIFLVGARDGLICAIYMLFFLVYLLSPQVATRTRHYLTLFCEIHFGTLYLMRLDMISAQVEGHHTWLKPILSELGLLSKAGIGDFLMIAALLCFSTVQNHGLGLLLSISTLVEKSPHPPLGCGILKTRSRGSILLSVCASHNIKYFHEESNLTVKLIMRNLSEIGEVIRATYRSFGTYIACVTVLIVVYVLGPNYISFGYLILLLFWMAGRQLLGRTRTRLWLPLVIYAVMVFIFHYFMTCFPELQKLIASKIALYPDLGFKPTASIVDHLWDSLVILAVMQLFRYERAQQSGEIEHEQEGDHINPYHGYMALMKRFLILHSNKVLSITVFYASIAPVGAMGFVYLLMLIATSIMPKTSRFPARWYSVYTALLIAAEFLYQMLGEKFQMFPEQVHGPFAYWVGFRVFQKNFWGLESGLRSRALVFASCLLQYGAFGWLELLPASLRNNGPLDEPCFLFVPYPRREHGSNHCANETDPFLDRSKQDSHPGLPGVHSDPSFPSHTVDNKGLRRSHSLQNTATYSSESSLCSGLEASLDFRVREVNRATPGFSLNSPSTKENRQWSKRAMLILRRERYEAQLRTIRIYAKYLTENFFNLFGLEISMFVLLIASFAVLNVISLMYMAVLGLCVLLNKRILRFLWPYFVVLFASVLVVEYVALGQGPPPWSIPRVVGENNAHCHTCWQRFQDDFDHCSKCWLGVVVDDWKTLVAYFMVFLIACLKLKSNMCASKVETLSFHHVIFPPSDRLAWKEINYETKGQWTWLDHYNFFFYRHLLDIVLVLVLITGTLQYDVLHLGYLAFALVFFRMRVTILKRRNTIFRFLRLYNFVLIILSLLYQAPYFGDTKGRGCVMPEYLYDVVGLVKFAYGFDIYSRSALVDITIFCVVGLQSSIFCCKNFEQVLRYLEAEEMDVKLQAQEKKAAWKKEQLQRIREMEERKHQRRLQVEKMKMEMLHLQLNVDVLNSPGRFTETKSSVMEPSDQVMNRHDSQYTVCYPSDLKSDNEPQSGLSDPDSVQQMNGSPEHSQGLTEDASGCRRRNSSQHQESLARDARPSLISGKIGEVKELQKTCRDCNVSEICEEVSAGGDSTTFESKKRLEYKKSMDSISRPSYLSGVQMFGDGVAQVQTFGNKALADLVGFLNIEESESDDTEGSSVEEEGGHVKTEDCVKRESFPLIADRNIKLDSADSSAQKESLNEMCCRIRMLCQFTCSKIRSNIDIVCYFFFLIAYTWDFSLLMLVYPAALFLYALLVNPGPNQHFWRAMLIYTELNILLQYMYQVTIHHCGYRSPSPLVKTWLERAGIPAAKMSQSFVTSVLPLFLIYLPTLVQCSIKAQDGEWMSVSAGSLFLNRRMLHNQKNKIKKSWKDSLLGHMISVKEKFESVSRGFLRYWMALVYGSEAPPYFVQVSMSVNKWPEDGIQPERIESGFNKLLNGAHQTSCQAGCQQCNHTVSSVRVESIENSPDKMDIAVAVLEVIYAAPRKGCPTGDHYSSLTPAEDVASEIQKVKDEGLVDAAIFPFPILSVIAGGKREVDLYAYIFGTDLIAFFLVGLFYQTFIKNSPEILNVYQLEDQFPKEFVFILMTLFFLIIVDRVIYLCSFSLGKICYYFCNLGFFTYYVTRYDWQIEPKGHGLLLLRIFCLTKALSLSLQALQIKSGLPHKAALYEQFLTREVSSLNLIGFRLYRSLPFLFELRCILDWSCSATSLTMYDWLKLEDIYASLYLVQCDAKLARAKHQIGEKRGVWTKFFSGICTFLVLICIIWTPMLMYSSGNPTNTANPIFDVRTQIDIKTKGGKFTLYQTSLCQIFSMEDLVASGFSLDPILQAYDLRDMQLICCDAAADSLWLVPPSTVRSLMILIREGFTVISKWEFSRQRPKTYEVATFSNETSGSDLEQAFNETLSTVRLSELYPRYFRVTSTGEVRMLEGSMEKVSGNLTLNQAPQSWWSFFRDEASSQEHCGSLDGPVAITVSEEAPQGLIGDTLSKFSITSLYITFVLAVGRFIRLQCADLRMRIPYENLPSCDRLVAICEDIYAARAAGELALEEVLFWTLVKIYRSPHALLEYTKAD